MPDFVYVANRLPFGIHLDVVKANGEAVRHTINGSSKSRLIGGAGITPVPKDLWQEWVRTHSGSELIKNKVVFESKSMADAETEAEILKSQKTGLEQVRASKQLGLEEMPIHQA